MALMPTMLLDMLRQRQCRPLVAPESTRRRIQAGCPAPCSLISTTAYWNRWRSPRARGARSPRHHSSAAREAPASCRVSTCLLLGGPRTVLPVPSGSCLSERQVHEAGVAGAGKTRRSSSAIQVIYNSLAYLREGEVGVNGHPHQVRGAALEGHPVAGRPQHWLLRKQHKAIAYHRAEAVVHLRSQPHVSARHLGCGGQEVLRISQQRSTFGAALQLWHIQAAGCKCCQVLLLYVRALLWQYDNRPFGACCSMSHRLRNTNVRSLLWAGTLSINKHRWCAAASRDTGTRQLCRLAEGQCLTHSLHLITLAVGMVPTFTLVSPVHRSR